MSTVRALCYTTPSFLRRQESSVVRDVGATTGNPKVAGALPAQGRRCEVRASCGSRVEVQA